MAFALRTNESHDALGLSAGAAERLKTLRVLVAGLGNIGFWVALLLAPQVALVRLVDRGFVEPHNALNQLYGPQSVGLAKVAVAADLLRTQVPQLRIEARAVDLADSPWDDFATTDVCLAGLDSLQARQIVSERTYPLGIPYIDGGVGEPLLARVQVLLPQAACLECDWSGRHYRQLAAEQPCRPNLAAEGPRTLAPGCAGAVVAGLMVAQLIRLFSGDPPRASYEISGDLLAGRFLSSRRRRNAACRFHHPSRPQEFGLGTGFERATVADLIRCLRQRFGDAEVQLEARRGLFQHSLYASDRYTGLEALAALADTPLVALGLTERDRLIVRADGRPAAEHLCLGQPKTSAKR